MQTYDLNAAWHDEATACTNCDGSGTVCYACGRPSLDCTCDDDERDWRPCRECGEDNDD